MSKSNRKTHSDKEVTPKPETDFQPTKTFLKYLTLVQAAQVGTEDDNFDSINAERQKITQQLAARRARNISEVFEKIFVWRMESFDPGETGLVLYDDMFPLSVYFDLKRFTKFKGAPRDVDRMFENRLRNTGKKRGPDRENALKEAMAAFGAGDSSKVH